jgi:drug/metabolite transporter (DMT)-like permease
MENGENKTKYIIVMVIAMIVWGVAWTSGKAVSEHSNPEVAAFWRYSISFITIIPVLIFMKVPLKTDKIGIFYMVGAGLLSALFNYLFFVGLSHGASGYGGTLVTSISPIVTYLLSILILGVKVSLKQVIALIIGIIGAVVLLQIPSHGFGFLDVNSIYFLECALVWSFITILSQKTSSRANPMFYTLIVFGISSLVNLIFAWQYHPFALTSFDSVFWWNILFIAIFSGTFSMTLFFVSASKLGAPQAAVFMFIVPVGAIVSGWAVYHENIVLTTVIGAVLSFIAVVMFNINFGNLFRKKGEKL